jgi:hypothetical protein
MELLESGLILSAIQVILLLDASKRDESNDDHFANIGIIVNVIPAV